tara:strand:+ start:2081 stop:2884 length:804 start_codon:yes stop_codon:yes gene_type:complete
MVQAITLLLFFSLLSFNALAGNNLITIQTKGSGTTITTKQVGTSNTTGIYCGLGSFDSSLVNTHNCDNATITATVTGISNIVYSQSVWSNHDGQSWITTVIGNDNYAVIDMDEDDNTSTIIQTGNDNDAWILGSGDDNVYKIEQTGNEMYGKIISFSDDSDIWITQEGSGDHNAYVYSSSSAHNNSTRLIQKGSGNKDADIFWYSGADDGDVTLTQQGNGVHTSLIKFYTDDYDVTVVQKGSSNKSYSATFNCTSNCDKVITITQQD